MAGIWQQVLATSALEWLGTVTGLLAVGLSVRQHRAAWPLFIVCYAAYAWLSADARLFAAAGMNGVFVLLSIEGWRAWRAGANEGSPSVIQRATRRVWVAAAATWVGASGALLLLLLLSGRAGAPWLDASATAAGFVAQWLLSRKNIATWAFWILSDLLFMALYGQAGYWLTVVLFGVFIVLAVQGVWTWRRLLVASVGST